MPERKFDDFDAYASSYREIHSDNIRISGAGSYYFAEMKVRLLTVSERNKSLSVLDVGCGDGATEIFFQQYFPDWDITGIDVSEASIMQATQRGLPAHFFWYDGVNMDFPDATFDIVFMAGVLHHVSYPMHTPLLEEIYRVLKVGGRLHLFEHNPLNPLTRHLVNTCVFDRDAKLLRSSYMARLLKKYFTIQRRTYIIFFPRKGFFLKLLFLERYLQWLPFGGQYYYVSAKG
jgi:SAM-dependent methyltransferase